MSRRAITALLAGTVVAGLCVVAPTPAAAAAEPSLSQQVRDMLTSGTDNGGAPAPTPDLALGTSAPQTTAGGAVTLTSDLQTTGNKDGNVAFQRMDPTAGADQWVTVATAKVGADGKATTTTQVAGAPVADFRAVFPDPGEATSDTTLPPGTVVSAQLQVNVVAAGQAPISSVAVTGWPAGPLDSNGQYPVSVTVSGPGGAAAAGIAVALQYSTDGVTWLPVGLPLNDSATAPVSVPVTGANGTTAATLVAPTAAGSNITFRAVAGLNSAPSAPSAPYDVAITSTSVYNAPAYSTSGNAQPNTMPTRPGVLIKAQKLDPNGATVTDRPLQYPAVPATNPLDPSQALAVPQVAGAGAPECFYRQNVRLPCVVGSTDGQGQPLAPGNEADQYRILYSDKRFIPNPPPYTDEKSIGGDQSTLEAASALVIVPKNATPTSKVVAWTHPTIGQANQCSVTRGFESINTPLVNTPGPGGAQINAGDMSFFLEQTLADGDIVVMPDYMGIAVNGPTQKKKSYLVGQQEARDVYYGVKALQTATAPGWTSGWKGTDFVAVGHSQGGHAAMWTGIESRKDWVQPVGLNVKGVVAVAPATDINKIATGQWEGALGWVLGPEIIQTYLGISPQFTQFALANNVVTPVGIQNFPTFQDYCTTQAFAASTPFVNNNQNFLQNPADPAFTGFYLNWGKVFAQQSPIITPGQVNSFPQDLPLQLISGTADNVVVAQANAAMQQSFCLLNPDGTPRVPMRAFWLPSMTGINTNPASKFTGSITDTTLTVDQMTGGPGSQYNKALIGSASGTSLPVANTNNIKVGDTLVGWGPDANTITPAPANTTVTAIDYPNVSITVSNSVSPPADTTLFFQPANPGPLVPGMVINWVVKINGEYTDRSATIAARGTGSGGPGTYTLTPVPVSQDAATTTFQVFPTTTPVGQASPVSNLQVPDHLNPLTFPFTQTQANPGSNQVLEYKVTSTGGTGRLIWLRLKDTPDPAWEAGTHVVVGGLQQLDGLPTKVDPNGSKVIDTVDSGQKILTYKNGGTSYPKVVDWTPATSGATVSDAPVFNNSASTVLDFNRTVLAGGQIKPDCGELDEAHSTGAPGSKATGTSWYNFPAFGLLDLPDYKNLPTKESFYKSWGSPALMPPTQENAVPSLGLLFFKPPTDIAQVGCAFPWKPISSFTDRPTNPACAQYGVWPYGQFTYGTHDVSTESWGVYPNDGQNQMVPAGITPAPQVEPSVYTEITPTRVFDSRQSSGPIPAGGSVVIDATGGGAIDLPEDTTAVAYNLTVTDQTGPGYATVTPGNVVNPPLSSTINWQNPGETVANGFISGLDAQHRLAVFVGPQGSSTTTQVIVDIVGYYAKTGSGSVFVPISPSRAYDSRFTTPISTGQDRTVNVVAGTPGVIPDNATGIAYNLTITSTTGSGYLAVVPASVLTPPTVSTINWFAPGTTIANATQVGLTDKSVKVFADGGGSTQFIIDVVGYFVTPEQLPPGVTGSRFVAIDPTRAYDSRTAGGPLVASPGVLSAGRTTGVGVGGVPANATAVAYNLTETDTVNSGYLTVAPGGSAPPNVSAINWMGPNTTLANGSTVGVNASQQITTWAFGGNSQYVVDVAGYYK